MPTLNWIGKEKVVTHHNDVPYRVLDHKYDYGTPNPTSTENGEADNMIIHGDNLEALKALLPKYEGQVDCIYIDPPYNTGNEKWVYNDNVNDPHIRKWLGQVVGPEAEDLTRHDKWLCMMYPRLVLLQKLLAPTGAIFISIDDNEQANLKLICDEIFGAGNFVSCFIWHKKVRPSNKLVDKERNASLGISLNTEYVLCYAQHKENVLFSIDEIDNNYIKRTYRNPDNDERGLWRTAPLWAESNSNKEKTLILKDGTPLTKKWFINQETLDRLYAEDLIYQAKNSLSKKIYLSEATGQAQMNLLEADLYGTSEEGTKEYKQITGSANFTNPKPVRLIEHLTHLLHNKKNALILDSFAGSGTTAHAVLNLNKQDGGHRRFILCEMCDYAETITAERVRRVIDGYGEGNKAVEGTGGSFAYYELGEPIFVGEKLNEAVDTEQLREYIWYCETHQTYAKNTERSANAYHLGNYNEVGYYFYYEKDKVTTLDKAFLNIITARAEQYIIYADNCLLSDDFMRKNNIVFKKIPRDIRNF